MDGADQQNAAAEQADNLDARMESLLDYTLPSDALARMQASFHTRLWEGKEWLLALNTAAEWHLEDVVLPRMSAKLGRQPQWSVMGFRLSWDDLSYHGRLLIPILAVGTPLAGNEPMPLIESESVVFNHIPAKTVVFDASAFDAGLALATGPGSDGEMDLTPILQAFERQLLARGMRGFNEGDRPVPYLDALNWDSMAKLASSSAPVIQ